MLESTAQRLPARAIASRPPAAGSHGLLGIPRFRFESGDRQERVVVAWRLVGPAGAPVVAALGGISAGREACDPGDPERGWWRELAGPVYPAMAGIGCTALWQPEALIEILGVAVIPDERLRKP